MCIERDADGMRRGLKEIGGWGAESGPHTRASFERKQMATLSSLMLGAALTREESRGGHFRRDFPARDDVRWRKQQIWVRGD